MRGFLARRAERPRDVTIASGVVLVAVVIALFPVLAEPWSPWDCLISRSLEPPEWPAHPFGYDIQGCDLLGLTLVGTRFSLLVGVGAALLAAAIALPLGAISGAFGGWFDAVVSRLADLVIGLPIVLVGLVVLSGLDERGPLVVIIVLAIAAWPIHARVVRVVAQRVSGEPYVDAARALGASRTRVLLKHILPATTGTLVAVIPTTIAFSIGVEAILSFVGAGLRLPAISWGVLLGEIQFNIRRAPHLVLPGLVLLAVSAALVVLGEAWRHRDLDGDWTISDTDLSGSAGGDAGHSDPEDGGPPSQVTILDPRRESGP